MSAVFDSATSSGDAEAKALAPPMRYLAMLASVLLLLLTGVVMVLSASTWTAVMQKGDAFSLFSRHAVNVTIAVFALLMACLLYTSPSPRD